MECCNLEIKLGDYQSALNDINHILALDPENRDARDPQNRDVLIKQITAYEGLRMNEPAASELNHIKHLLFEKPISVDTDVKTIKLTAYRTLPLIVHVLARNQNK